MATNYAGFRSLAERLIASSGQSVPLITKGNTGGYDDSGNVLAPTPDTSITGTTTPILRYKSHDVDGSSILTSDGYVFYHSNSQAEKGMYITISGDELRVVRVTELKSVGGISVLT
ncbi:MAG: hypothetical protein GY776_13375, partial [Alteromonas sp.]|nr:hypothetical protein [Alteromonas sp.]